MPPTNKSELIDYVRDRHNVTRKQAAAIVDSVFEGLTESLRKGVRLRVTGFGTFVVRERPPRTARNPRTGMPIALPARRVVAFRPDSALKRSVNFAAGLAAR